MMNFTYRRLFKKKKHSNKRCVMSEKTLGISRGVVVIFFFVFLFLLSFFLVSGQDVFGDNSVKDSDLISVVNEESFTPAANAPLPVDVYIELDKIVPEDENIVLEEVPPVEAENLNSNLPEEEKSVLNESIEDYFYLPIEEVVGEANLSNENTNIDNENVSINFSLVESSEKIVYSSSSSIFESSSDSSSLALTLFSPVNQEFSELGNISFNFSVFGNDSFCKLSIYQQSSEVFSSTFNGGGNYSKSFSFSDVGDYSWKVNCSANEEAIEEQRNFSVVGPLRINRLGISSSVGVYPFSLAFEVLGGNRGEMNCSVVLSNSSNAYGNSSIFYNNGTFNTSFVLGNGNYFWNASCSSLSNLSIAVYDSGALSVNVDYTPVISFNADRTSALTSEKVSFNFNITKPYREGNINWSLEFRDGSSLQSVSSSIVRELIGQVNHSYNSSGNFVATLTSYVDGKSYQRNLSMVVSPWKDITAPIVSYIYPEDNGFFSRKDVSLSYRVSDDVKIDNCTLEVYYYSALHSSLDLGTPFFKEIKKDISNNSIVNVSVGGLSAGDYSWSVVCYDNSSNRNSENFYDFSVVFYDLLPAGSTNSNMQLLSVGAASSSDIAALDGLIERLNNFMVNEASMSAEEQAVMNAMGLEEDLAFYKKKLVQDKLDLEGNLDYIVNEALREKRKQEIAMDIVNYSEVIPSSLKVIKNSEFYKNVLDVSLNDIVANYSLAKNKGYSSSEIRDLAEAIKSLQKDVSISVAAYHVDISYGEKNRQFTLVEKKIKHSSLTGSVFLEYIPKEVAETSEVVTMIPAHEVIAKDPIFAILPEDLDDGKLVYFIEGHVSLKGLEKSDSVLFIDQLPKKKILIMTGFASAFGIPDLGIWIYVLYAFLLILVIVLFSGFFRSRKIARWKNNKEFRMAIYLVREGKKNISKKEIALAKDNYVKLEKIYPQIIDEAKPYVYVRIHGFGKEIDRFDISMLIKGCLSAIKAYRRDEALTLYKDIRSIYHRLTREQKKIVFTKIRPVLEQLKGI